MDRPQAPISNRILASLIDGAIVWLLTMWLATAVISSVRFSALSLGLSDVVVVGCLAAVAAAVSIAYCGFLGRFSATPGQFLGRIRLTHAPSGGRINPWRGALRSAPVLAPVVIAFVLLPVAGYSVLYLIPLLQFVAAAVTWFTIARSPTGQGWHDRLGQTVVYQR